MDPRKEKSEKAVFSGVLDGRYREKSGGAEIGTVFWGITQKVEVLDELSISSMDLLL